MKEHFEDCQVGERLVTTGRTITETDLVLFSAFTGDWNVLHADADFARRGPFGERIAHGMLTLVVGLNLLFRDNGYGTDLFPTWFLITGIERVRFIMPVKIGDTVRLDCETVETKRATRTQGALTVRFHILNQRNEMVVSGRVILMVECRALGEAVNDDQ